jgi:L-ascorbate metabolism protein UlaG (beta-lactamase superfamily)
MKALLLCGALVSLSFTGAKSDHFDGKTFHHPWGAIEAKSFFSVLKWKLTTDAAKWPAQVPITPRPLPAQPVSGVDVTWINHATFLVRFLGLNILTDPVWAERASPFSFMGPRRVHAPGVPFAELPPIHVVVLSHNHYDHLNVETLRKLEERDHPLFLVPLGDKEWLVRKGLTKVRELDWWEEEKVGEASFIFTPAQHWSARSLWDRNESLWGGWWLRQGTKSVYHGGDTGLGPHFRMIRERLGVPTVALLPIGAYEPRWFMESMHLNPSDAVQAALQLGAPTNVGMHFGTFQLTDEGHQRPAEELRSALVAHPTLDFRVPAVGETFHFE